MTCNALALKDIVCYYPFYFVPPLEDRCLQWGHNPVVQALLNLSPLPFFFIYRASIEKDTGDFDIYFNYCVCRQCSTHFF